MAKLSGRAAAPARRGHRAWPATRDLLFLDEPTTGFDPSARRSAWEMVRNLAALGKTVFLTTHYMDEAQYLANRVAVIVEGRIVAEGPPAHARRAATARDGRSGSASPTGAGDPPDWPGSPPRTATGRSSSGRPTPRPCCTS